ncbi:MAG TPA: sensor histidine kinase [Anaerolineales bacterium]|nr:sensor histidine kinase [Anaerolineales bacterium]
MKRFLGLFSDPSTDPRLTPYQLEPGLLSVFRAFTWLRAALTLLPALLALIIALLLPLTGLIKLDASQFPSGTPENYFRLNRALFVTSLIVLLVYLYWPRLPEKLGRFYLPIAIFIATIEPIFSQNILYAFTENRFVDITVIGGAWSLLPILFAPLVLVAWQYSLRHVVLFVTLTTLTDFTLLSIFTGTITPDLLPIYAAMATRTFAMLVAGYLVVQLMKTQRTQRTALQKANADLQGYLVTQEQLTTSRERNRLARELHDTLAHTLSMLAVQLEATKAVWEDDPAEARSLLDQSLSATRAGLTETRRALQALRASPLEDLGITLALQTLAESVATRNGLSLDLQLPETLPPLTPLAEQTLYRTAQESLANITQHAGATRAALHLTHTDTTLTLTVSDNGRGFDPDTVAGAAHFGLRGLRERAEMAGGQLTVESKAGEGTRVKLEMVV